jgi:hypothetical protein
MGTRSLSYRFPLSAADRLRGPRNRSKDRFVALSGQDRGPYRRGPCQRRQGPGLAHRLCGSGWSGAAVIGAVRLSHRSCRLGHGPRHDQLGARGSDPDDAQKRVHRTPGNGFRPAAHGCCSEDNDLKTAFRQPPWTDPCRGTRFSKRARVPSVVKTIGLLVEDRPRGLTRRDYRAPAMPGARAPVFRLPECRRKRVG